MTCTLRIANFGDDGREETLDATAPAGPEQLAAEVERLRRQLALRSQRELVGQCPASERLRDDLAALAASDGPAALIGAPGCGIDLAAQIIHESSRRSHRPFVKVDASVLSSDSLERALFGERGNLREGTEPIPGRLELAAGGTLFIDRIEEVGQSLQRALAEVVRDRRYATRNAPGVRPLDVRILVSSRDEAPVLASRGVLRSDCELQFFQHVLRVPTLAERKSDIGLLSEHFLHRLSVSEGRIGRSLTVEALAELEQYGWPGNVRELENVIERACALDEVGRLTAEMVRPWIAQSDEAEGASQSPTASLSLREMERKLIETTFARCGGNRERTARLLQIGIRTLSGKLREYGYPPRGGPGSNRDLRQRRAA